MTDDELLRTAVERALSKLETLRVEMRADGDMGKLFAGDLLGVILGLREALE